MNPTALILVALGGAIGSTARYVLAFAAARALPAGFPWGTIIINILGSFAIGWFAVLSAQNGRLPQTETTRAFVMAGLCGGFTTFSAFSLQTFELLRAGEHHRAFANIVVSVMFCLAATMLGATLGIAR